MVTKPGHISSGLGREPLSADLINRVIVTWGFLSAELPGQKLPPDWEPLTACRHFWQGPIRSHEMAAVLAREQDLTDSAVKMASAPALPLLCHSRAYRNEQLWPDSHNIYKSGRPTLGHVPYGAGCALEEAFPVLATPVSLS